MNRVQYIQVLDTSSNEYSRWVFSARSYIYQASFYKSANASNIYGSHTYTVLYAPSDLKAVELTKK